MARESVSELQNLWAEEVIEMELMAILLGLTVGGAFLSLLEAGNDEPNHEVDPEDVPEGDGDLLEDDEVIDGAGDSEVEISGSADPDLLEGAESNDTINSLAGDDLVFGNDGDDLLNGRAAARGDLVAGSYDWESLAGPGADTLYGGDGNDTLGIAELDVGSGGLGDDLFSVFHSDQCDADSVPIVEDFDPERDQVSVTMEFSSNIPEDAVGEYLGGGNFELNMDVSTARTADGQGMTLFVGENPVATFKGITELDVQKVQLFVFIGDAP